MYLYYDKTRTLKTTLTHGDPLREKSDANIFVCLDKDFFGDNLDEAINSILSASVTYENGKFGANGVTSEPPKLVPFKRINTSEITYYLQHNKHYWTYQLKFDAVQITNYPGKIYFNLEIINESVSKSFSNAELYVESRTGLPEYDNSIKNTQYNEIVRRLNNLDSEILAIKNKIEI